MEESNQNSIDIENREMDNKFTTTTFFIDDKSGSCQSESDSVYPNDSKLNSRAAFKRKPFTSRDSFDIETKFVVLSFMKNVPKDVEQRTWTPVSSTPSSETGGNLVNNQLKLHKQFHHKSKGVKRHKVALDDNKHINNTADIDQNRFDTGSSTTTSAQSYHRGDSNGFDQRLEFERCGPGNDTAELVRNNQNQVDVKSPTNGHSSYDTTDCPHYGRTISSSSSRGDGSVVTDADDELGSSSSHSSNQDRFGSVDEHDIQFDGLSQGFSISDEDDKNFLQAPDSRAFQNADFEISGASGRKKHLSSTHTIVPTSVSNDLPSSLEDHDDFQEEDILVFSDSPKPERSALCLDLDVCHGPEHPSNIIESLSAVLVQNSTELESEVNNAVVQGQLTPTEQTRVSSLASTETQVALLLRNVADRVEAEYGRRIQTAVENAFRLEANIIPYNIFQTAFTDAMGTSLTGITEVALCLMYSQRLTFAMLQSGHNQVNYLLDYAARLVAENAADFIINQGGWSSIAESDIDSLNASRGSGDSRVSSPTKQERPMEAIPETSTPTSKPIQPQTEPSSDESSDDSREQRTEQRSQYSSFFTPLFQRASYLGYRFSIVAAVTVIGIAIVLSKQ